MVSKQDVIELYLYNNDVDVNIFYENVKSTKENKDKFISLLKQANTVNELHALCNEFI